jgi:transglutaminase-like putative cysteine protease
VCNGKACLPENGGHLGKMLSRSGEQAYHFLSGEEIMGIPDQMNRRTFLRTTGIMTASLAFLRAQSLFAQGTKFGTWRTFEVTTRVEVLRPLGPTRIWLPTALTSETPYQKTLSDEYKLDGGTARLIRGRTDFLGIVAAEFPAGVAPILTLTSRVNSRDITIDLAMRSGRNASRDELQFCLRPTKLLPTDGIVRETAMEITQGATTDVDKARAIYDWIVDHTARNPKTRGCGLGDIRFMLESGDLTGKCADLNALFVGLSRAAGVPARDVYGVRTAASRRGYKSLGTSSEIVTQAQHCRAEVHLDGYGWVPVDPADVRKVMLEEPPGNRPIDDEMVERARAALFGSWEMNYMAFNTAHDVELPGSKGPAVGYLMYPQAETNDGRVDSLNPDNFKYEITAKEIKPARA